MQLLVLFLVLNGLVKLEQTLNEDLGMDQKGLKGGAEGLGDVVDRLDLEGLGQEALEELKR